MRKLHQNLNVIIIQQWHTCTHTVTTVVVVGGDAGHTTTRSLTAFPELTHGQGGAYDDVVCSS